MKDLLDRAYGLGFEDGADAGYWAVENGHNVYLGHPLPSPSSWTDFVIAQMGHTGSHRYLCGREPNPDDEPLYGACLEWYGRGCYAGYRQATQQGMPSSS